MITWTTDTEAEIITDVLGNSYGIIIKLAGDKQQTDIMLYPSYPSHTHKFDIYLKPRLELHFIVHTDKTLLRLATNDPYSTLLNEDSVLLLFDNSTGIDAKFIYRPTRISGRLEGFVYNTIELTDDQLIHFLKVGLDSVEIHNKDYHMAYRFHDGENGQYWDASNAKQLLKVAVRRLCDVKMKLMDEQPTPFLQAYQRVY